jgi:hypothetical protein
MGRDFINYTSNLVKVKSQRVSIGTVFPKHPYPLLAQCMNIKMTRSSRAAVWLWGKWACRSHRRWTPAGFEMVHSRLLLGCRKWTEFSGGHQFKDSVGDMRSIE